MFPWLSAQLSEQIGGSGEGLSSQTSGPKGNESGFGSKSPRGL